ncbi:41278_t:CDS:2 [Gigaspora margarita]|uniref:41278_t:CDS:1 n=1 Tax=Gigaspora margarita TaxID=4874 RepID=A0ABM8VXK8_GIGMA|nr:41278_t:CDS:2 [Gigaspora margarita]
MAMSDAFKNSSDSLTRTGNYGIRLTFDSSSPINNLIAQELISDDAICAQKLNINLRKTQVEIEIQHRQMELMRFEWINESLIGDNNSSIRQQITNENTREPIHSFNDAVANQQMIFAQEFERMKHVVSLRNSILYLETFRTVTDKTIAMDADTLRLVKRLEHIAKDLRTVIEEIHNLTTNFEMDTTDYSGKDTHLKAKVTMNICFILLIFINGALAAFDRQFRLKKLLLKVRIPNNGMSYLTDTIVRVFESLLALGEVIQHYSSQNIFPKILRIKIPMHVICSNNTGTYKYLLLWKSITKETEEFEQNESYNDKIKWSLKKTITGQVLLPSNEETVEN